jgi:predicted unusual protein kinase regulating ubiquinone biosynthesis (AarF/ABC1/UbiB family)
MNDLPRKAVTRTARLAALPLGYAGRTALGMGKRLGGAPADSVVSEVQLRTAEQLFRTLGELKGGAMKIGQAMSIMESALPEEVAAPYRQQLTRLQDSAPPMAAQVVHQQLARELGPRWRRRLVELDDNPAAAASIGQVHRGRWEDGTEVAVKIQYPGAAEALQSDLRQIGRLARTFAGLVPGVDVKALVEELQARLLEELDYDLEADAQARYAEVFAGDARYKVPRVLAHTGGVLVSEWLHSTGSLARLIAEGTRAERDHYGGLYARFMFEGSARTGLLHADPHPGNYRVVPGEEASLGRLGVLDYGAVARLVGGELPPAIGRLLRIALRDDFDEVLGGLREEGFVRPSVRVDPRDLQAYLGPFLEPARTETFRFTRDFMREQAARLNDPRAPGSSLVFRLTLPASYLLIHRAWVGSIGVLCQLDAEIPFRALLEESLPGFADVA